LVLTPTRQTGRYTIHAEFTQQTFIYKEETETPETGQ
jgi:hypothetical protein